MFATSTRFAAFAVILAAALPTILATPTKRQTYDLGGLTINLGELVNGINEADGQIAAAVEPSTAARVKARSLRRRGTQYHINLCPGSFQACSLPSGAFECLDTTQELNACGACLEEGGRDCEQIPNVENVSCAAGTCEIHSCVEGYTPNLDKTACVARADQHRRRFSKKH